MAAIPRLFVFLLHVADWACTLAEELYSQNAICRQHSCVNPLFPGLNDLPRLEQIVWQCTSHRTVSTYLEFCKDAVLYDPALPSPNSSSQAVSTLVKAQDDAAATMFFYHLSGLGYEAWDHPTPAKDADACVQSVWRMVCFTYFPKVEAGCQVGQSTPYLRPCSSCCEAYLTACAVECCDESPRCVFQHSVLQANGGSVLQTGYVQAAGPSALCTGSSATRGHGGSGGAGTLLLLLGLLAGSPLALAAIGADNAGGVPFGAPTGLAATAVVASLVLQGCDVDVPRHQLGNWRAKSDYLVAFEFLPPGQPASSAQLNSCMAPAVAATAQCSGKGFCREWNPESARTSPVSFCVCDRDWADPECRTRRKSQTTAFLCALFGGLLGIDYFYLGFPLWGIAKLATLGGLGFWWLVDIVRAGSGPIYAHDYRVANDLPHWVFVLVTVAIFAALGFLFSIESYLSYRKKKREDVLRLQEGEEARRLHRPDEMDGPRLRPGAGLRSFESRRGFSGYGATLPALHPNAGAPCAAPGPAARPPAGAPLFAGAGFC